MEKKNILSQTYPYELKAFTTTATPRWQPATKQKGGGGEHSEYPGQSLGILGQGKNYISNK
jgi:hypothetical protein